MAGSGARTMRTTPVPRHPRMCQHALRVHPQAPDAGRRTVFGALDASSVVMLDGSPSGTSARALTDISLNSDATILLSDFARTCFISQDFRAASELCERVGRNARHAPVGYGSRETQTRETLHKAFTRTRENVTVNDDPGPGHGHARTARTLTYETPQNGLAARTRETVADTA